MTPLGLEALDVVRIEAGLIFAGYEFDDQVDPFEAGIGFAVALDSTDEDFIGRAALEERKAHPQRVLVGLELEGNEVAGHGDFVYVGRQRVGVVTSGCRSPHVRKPIALCRMSVQYAELGTERRGRQARRAAEAHRGDRRALPLLRPGQDSAAVMSASEQLRGVATLTQVSRASAPSRLRKAMGRFATGVTIVTTAQRDHVHGMTANGVMSVSLDPPLVVVSLGASRMDELLPKTRRYGISVLGAEQEELAQALRRAAGRGPRAALHVVEGAAVHRRRARARGLQASTRSTRPATTGCGSAAWSTWSSATATRCCSTRGGSGSSEQTR